MPRRRVIDQLRQQYPGKWHFEHPCFWHHETGWYVEACACLAPRYDGDDDTFVTRYFRSDTGEQVRLDSTGASTILGGVSVVFLLPETGRPNGNGDILPLGQLRGVKMLTDKPRSKVRHCDIKAPVKIQPSTKGSVQITGVTWFCSECHVELPGEHKADCLLIRKIMAGVQG